MVSKTQPVIPPAPSIQLETIYEESGGSLSSSINEMQYKIDNRDQSSIYWSNQTFHGLISARSIPTVDVHRRQKAYGCQPKPPIEVRFRDGTKRFIQPSLTTTSTMLKRRKNSRSSNQDSSSRIKINSKSRQISNTPPKKKQQLPKNPEIVLTIITAEELTQSGITPPSTSSIDESDTLAIVKSQSNSSIDTIKTVTDVSISDTPAQATTHITQPVAAIPPSIQPTKPFVDITVSNHQFPSNYRHNATSNEQQRQRSPPPAQQQQQYQQQQHQRQQEQQHLKQLPPQPPQQNHHHQQQLYQQQQSRQLRHPQQLNTIRSQSLPPAQSHVSSNQHKSIPNQALPVAVVPPSPKKAPPSLQITLTNDENERNFTSTINISQTKSAPSKPTNEKLNGHHNAFQPSTTILVGGGSRSAFRPFHKQSSANPRPQDPVNASTRSHRSTDQAKENKRSPKQQINQSSEPQQHHQYRTTSLSSMNRSTLQGSSGVNPHVHDRRAISLDASKQSIRSNISNQVVSDKTIDPNSKIKISNYSQQLPRLSSVKIVNNTVHQINPVDDQYRDTHNRSTFIDPQLQWHSVTSKSLFEVPRLSTKYSDIPLRITLPDRSPTHNQKLLKKHDIALENRLLNAGLSPETIALYERILEVSDVRHIARRSPPKIIDPRRRK